MARQSSRRGLFKLAAGGVGAVLARSIGAAATPGRESSGLGQSGPGSTNLLTDPRYQAGARFRLGRFIARGADAAASEAVFRRLSDLEPQRWVAEWARLAEPFEEEGRRRERSGDTSGAMNAYRQASLYYSLAKFPVPNHPAKQAAYQKCIDTYLKAAKYFDPPVERVAIPFEGKEIIAYLRKPKGVSRPPVTIATGGIDVYNEDRDTADFLDAGLAAFSMDIPGAGQSPVAYAPRSERVYTAVMEYLLTRTDLDGRRMAMFGRSYGGYWGAKMAFLEPKRLRACVNWGGPVHHTFQEAWIRHLQADKLYLWDIRDSQIYTHRVKDLAELLVQAPTLSLQTQGLLERPCAPLLNVNGMKDPWISIDDSYLLMETGEPKTMRLYPMGGHMGDDPASGKMIANWLRIHLTA